MSRSNVLLTGAGGFVGERVAHRIALGEDDLDLTALVHSPSGPGAMRIARLPIEIEAGSVCDEGLMTELMADCDGVINCAFGMGETSVAGTDALLEAAKHADIESFVHMSTAVVHGHDHETELTETAPFDPDGEYGEWKVKAEKRIQESAESAVVDPAVIRPMIVYGPYSNWITETLETIRRGAVLTDGGYGTLDQIYIDNLVDLVLLALRDPAADGETFLAVDDDTVTWRQYYDDLSTFIDDHPPRQTMAQREIEARRLSRLVTDSVVPPARIPKRLATSSATRATVASELSQTPWAEPVLKQLPDRLREKILEVVTGTEREPSFETLHDGATTERDERGPQRYELPSTRYATMQTNTGGISNEKAKELLDWEQRVTYDESLDLIGKWIAYEQIA